MGNDYLINPWFFYLAGCANSLRFAAAIVMVGVIMLLIIHAISSTEPFRGDNDKTFAERHKEAVIAVGIVSIVILLFVPSSGTLNRMYAASVVTRENLNMTRDELIELIKDASKAVEAVKNEK